MSLNGPEPSGGEVRLDRIAVIGAGIVGSVIAWVLARDGRKVLLLDRSDPALAGASFGNAGHIATERYSRCLARRRRAPTSGVDAGRAECGRHCRADGTPRA